jgi:hypothetical protein
VLRTASHPGILLQLLHPIQKFRAAGPGTSRFLPVKASQKEQEIATLSPMKPALFFKAVLVIAFTLSLFACHHPDHHERKIGRPVVVSSRFQLPDMSQIRAASTEAMK